MDQNLEAAIQELLIGCAKRILTRDELNTLVIQVNTLRDLAR